MAQCQRNVDKVSALILDCLIYHTFDNLLDQLKSMSNGVVFNKNDNSFLMKKSESEANLGV